MVLLRFRHSVSKDASLQPPSSITHGMFFEPAIGVRGGGIEGNTTWWAPTSGVASNTIGVLLFFTSKTLTELAPVVAITCTKQTVLKLMRNHDYSSPPPLPPPPDPNHMTHPALWVPVRAHEAVRRTRGWEGLKPAGRQTVIVCPGLDRQLEAHVKQGVDAAAEA